MTKKDLALKTSFELDQIRDNLEGYEDHTTYSLRDGTSKTAIKRRCMVARADLLEIMRKLEEDEE